MTSPHMFLSPSNLPPAPGFNHVAVAAAGRTVHVAGQIGVDYNGVIVGADFVEQFAAALDNVLAALATAGGRPGDIVTMTIYTTDMDAYRASLRRLGEVWQSRLERHYPAMALIGVAELVEPAAVIEIVATAVVTDDA